MKKDPQSYETAKTKCKQNPEMYGVGRPGHKWETYILFLTVEFHLKLSINLSPLPAIAGLL
jgi:hypothetical protein